MMNETPALFITVGIPGCGKTSYLDRINRIMVWDILSSDDIREDLTGSAEDQTVNRAVFYVINKCARLLLSHGHNVCIDATNLKPEFRQGLLDLALECKAIPVAFRFEDSEDFELCQGRNLDRIRVVPENIMRAFHSTFLASCTEDQLWDEGWQVTPTVNWSEHDDRFSGGDTATGTTDPQQKHP